MSSDIEVSHGTATAEQLWCDDRTRDHVMDPTLALVAAEKSDELYDFIDMAWGIIANAYGGDWEKAPPEWRQAAEKWRDRMPEIHGPPPESPGVKPAEGT